MKQSRYRYKEVVAVLCIAAFLFGGCGRDAAGTAASANGQEPEAEQSGSGNSAGAENDTEDRTGDTTERGTGNGKEQPTAAPEFTATPEPVVRDMRDELAAELEQEVRALYEQQLLLHEAVRTIVAEEIENTSFVTIDPREQFSVTEVLIDEATGNPVVSEGVKEFLKAASEGKSLQEMCHAAVDGSVSQIPDYLAGTLEGSIQDAVTSLIGVDIFTPLSVVSQWMNPDQEPTALLQGIVEEQQKDVGALALFMRQEEIGTADIYKVAQMVYAVEQRTQEISAAQGGIREYPDNASAKLRSLALQFAGTEAQLAAYGEIQLPDAVPELSAEDKRRISGLQSEISAKLEIYEPLYSLSVGNVSANYDVEGFREAQKAAAQAGLVGSMIFGDLVGGLMDESVQTFNGQIQENRRELCDLLTESMEESYVEVVAAQGAFMEQYSILLQAAGAADNELYFADIYLQGHEWEALLKEAAWKYMEALVRYVSDLDSANILYGCILTPQQSNYLFDLQIEIDSIYQALRDTDPAWNELGYSNDELLERWSRLVDCYVESTSFLVERGATMGEAPGFYGNGSGTYDGFRYKVYTKEFAAHSRPVLIVAGDSSYYYDMDGNLICVEGGIDGKVIGRSFYVLAYLSSAEGAGLQPFWNLEPGSEVMTRMDEMSSSAQKWYSYIWSNSQ